MKSKIAIIGKGAWGTAIGGVLERNGHHVAYVTRHDVCLPKQALESDYIVNALPAQVVRERLSELNIPNVPVLNLSKGIEIQTGLRMTQVLRKTLPHHPIAVLSGPNLASEVKKQLPSATTVATENEALCETWQKLLHQKNFRVYRSKDIVGVELGGALKNIYAISAGICSGLKMGENGMAGLLTRSLAEMVRIGMAMGAKKETLFGLSGAGDLILTAYSGASRNHTLGERIGKGMGVEEAMEKVKGVAEGYYTVKAVYKIAKEHELRAPVLTEVYRILYQHKSPVRALDDLLTRDVGWE